MGPPEYVNTSQKAEALFSRLIQKGEPIAFDTESTGLDTSGDTVVFWSLSDGTSRWALPASTLPAARVFFESDLEKWGWNIKFDLHMLYNSGVPSVNGRLVDGIVMDWLFDENNPHGLEECYYRYFGIPKKTFSETFGNPTATRPVIKIFTELLRQPGGLDTIVEYASADALATHQLITFLRGRLADIPIGDLPATDYFDQVEVPFTRTLYNMERLGVQINKDGLGSLEASMITKMDEVQRLFTKEFGAPINLNSPKQIAEFFFEYRGHAPIKQTKGGTHGIPKISTDASVLKILAEEKKDPFAAELLAYREVSKLKGTYTSSLVQRADEYNRIHTTLVQTGTVTGRLSSREPNLQNIPARSDLGKQIRHMFIAAPGYRLIVADYSQIEMRLMAHFSQDVKMVSAINNGIDLHCYTAAESSTVTMPEPISYEEMVAAKKAENPTEFQLECLKLRRAAKTTGFGLIYGIGPQKLALDLEVEVAIAKAFIAKYFETFPGVRDFIDYTKADCRRTGYVQTILGRYRRLSGINSSDRGVVAESERQSVNSIIQGSAADGTKLAMLTASTDPLLKRLGARMLLQVHDELIFEVPDNDGVVAMCTHRIKEIMENVYQPPLLVPTPVDIESAYTWGEAK